MARGQKAQPGDTRVAPNGYHYVRLEDRWELTHRVMMEEHIGRPLKKNERVSFKDLDRDNICLENLVLTEAKEPSAGKQLARLYARRAEIDAQIAELEEQE